MNDVIKMNPTNRLLAWEVESFRGVSVFRCDTGGNHVEVSGANGAGKSSALDAIWWVLGGKDKRELPEPIKKGETKAKATLHVGPKGGPVRYVLERTVNKSGTRIKVSAPDGSKFGNQEELMDSFCSDFCMDPGRFRAMRPQDQVDLVFDAFKIPLPIEQVKQITGERHEPRHGETFGSYMLRLSADDTGLYYIRRLEAHRVAEQKTKAHLEAMDRLEHIGGALLPDEQPASAPELIDRLKGLNQALDQRRKAIQDAHDAKQELDEGLRRKNAIAREITENEAKQEDLRKKIAALYAELTTTEQAMLPIKNRFNQAEDIVQDLKKDADESAAAAEKFPDPTGDIANLRTQLESVEVHNRRHSKRLAAQQEVERLDRERQETVGVHARLDLVLEQLRELRKHAMDGKQFGLEGLGLGVGELTYHDVPYRQLSTSEQLKIACLIAIAQRPGLPLLRLDNAESLDESSRRMVLVLADKYDFQVMMARVRDRGELAFELFEANAA